MFNSRKKKINLHVLHIGKTGGTSLKNLLVNKDFSRYKVIFHDHNYSLEKVPVGEKVIFFLRNPIDRFKSGFYSRKRKGFPSYDVPWNDEETIAFQLFETANDLSESLSSPDMSLYRQANHAMLSIRHVNSFYKDWLISEEYLLRRKNDIFYIGFQESFDKDCKEIMNMIKLQDSFDVPKLHRNTIKIQELSMTAIQNLNWWYTDDIKMHNFCLQLRREL